MIAIVDYRAGNLTSVVAAVNSIGCQGVVTDKPEDIAKADRIIFPGVGSAGSSMQNLHELGLAPALKDAIASGKPFLGICIGYQLLFENSQEDDAQCLGVLKGNVTRFPDNMKGTDGLTLKIPQMGWNGVKFIKDHPVWKDVPEGSEFYFVHSYHPNPEAEVAAGVTEYGVEFTSAVIKDNLIACQFHPEKSGRPGLQILKNFCSWNP